MDLKQNPKRRALWQRSAKASGPGTFALVIGISNYPHLLEGTGEETADAHDLGQLRVSALTAYRFFRWLCDEYRHEGAPLAKCWLLLSPTDAEVKIEPELKRAPIARFASCETAINEWFNAMRALHPAHGAKSRAFFFFSGHGVEVHPDRQILLPADYLRPSKASLNRAMSTQKLHRGLRALTLPEHFLFVDACRAGLPRLEGAVIEGEEILNQPATHNLKRGVVAPIIYATGSGDEAWQPPDAKERLSVFGRALIEGLTADPKAGMEPACDHQACRIQLFSLAQFLDERVKELLADTTIAPVRLGGTIAATFVTEVERPKRAGRRGPLIGKGIEPARTLRRATPGWRSVDAAVPQVQGRLHETFASESITYPWLSARAIPLRGNGETSFRVHEILQLGEAAYRLELSLERHGAHWFQLDDAHWRHRTDDAPRKVRFAWVLPDDGPDRPCPRYTVDFTAVRGLGLRQVQVQLAASRKGDSLRPPRDGARFTRSPNAAEIWDQYRNMSFEEAEAAVLASELQHAERALERKLFSPLSATVAGLFLIRLRRYDRLHHWLQNLANWFPDRPDGPVLWAEQVLQQSEGTTIPEEVFSQVLKLVERGLPHTSEAIGYASRQIDELLEFGAAKSSKTARRKRGLQALRERLRIALSVFQPGGLCAVYVGSPKIVRPALVYGPPVR